MQFFRIWILFKGYVIIIAKGAYIERFINICVHRKIILFDVLRKENCVILKTYANSFRLMRSVAKITGCSIKVLKKRGLPFFFRKYKKRKSFLIGSVMFVIIFAGMWSYIWEIEIIGDSLLKRKEVIDYLAKNNIGIGSVKYFLNTDKIEDDFILHFKNLAWVDIKVKGTKLVISAFDRTKTPNIIDENLPCDIVAKKDGIIEEVLVKNGVEVIKIGDAVLKGDVLISGIVMKDVLSDSSNMIHAIGNIKARTWNEAYSEVKLQKEKKIYTGDISKVYKLEFLDKKILNFKIGKGYDSYDKKNKVISVKFFENFVLPFKIKLEERVYYKNKQEAVSVDVAKKEALNKAINSVLKKIDKDANIIKQQVDYF